jgi:hypothetical protein
MRSLGAVPLLLLVCSLPAEPVSGAEFPQPGEWPCFRRDGGLLARSPARGRISEPRIVWKQFVGTLDTELIAEPGKGTAKRNLPVNESGTSTAEFAEARARFFRNDSQSNQRCLG